MNKKLGAMFGLLIGVMFILFVYILIVFIHEYYHYMLYLENGYSVGEMCILGFKEYKYYNTNESTIAFGWTSATKHIENYTEHDDMMKIHLEWDCLWYGNSQGLEACEHEQN